MNRKHNKDLVGTEKSADQCQEFVDYWYPRDRDASVFPVKDGEWAMTRDTENKGRGDRGSVKSRRDSVASSGVLCTRGGPFLYDDRNEKDVGKYDVWHVAALFEGMKQLWLEDPGHPSLQRSMTSGIPHAKIYNRNTPSFARKWIKDLGNAEADVVTLTTPIEVWGCTEETEAAFIAHKDELNLTVKSVGSQALWEEEKYKMAGRLYAKQDTLHQVCCLHERGSLVAHHTWTLCWAVAVARSGGLLHEAWRLLGPSCPEEHEDPHQQCRHPRSLPEE